MFHFFISDKNNHIRRNHIINEAKKLGISPNFYDAIMARNLSKEELFTLSTPDTFLTPGEIGCAASHLEALKLFLNNNTNQQSAISNQQSAISNQQSAISNQQSAISNQQSAISNQQIISAFFFEDDIVFSDKFTPDLINEITDFISSLEKPSILVLFNSIYKKKKIKDFQTCNISVFSAHNFFGTYGYVINRKAAENILTIQTPIKFEIDAFKFYYWLSAVDLYCLNANLVEPAPTISELSEINDGHSRGYTKQRTIKKNKAFRLLYNQLSCKDKLSANIKRIQKALHKPFEKL